jgi:hypothetical protein
MFAPICRRRWRNNAFPFRQIRRRRRQPSERRREPSGSDCERRKSRAAVLRRSERRRFPSASDDEVGGFHARLREQSQINWRVPAIPLRQAGPR